MLQPIKNVRRAVVTLLALVCLAGLLVGQEQSAGSGPSPQNGSADSVSTYTPVRPVPVVSGFGAFIPTWEGGAATLVTIISPVVLVPLGDHWLLESRAAFEGDFSSKKLKRWVNE